MAKERIELENLINTRDLGGYVNEDGLTIKPKKLIRSAALSKASEADLEKLCKEYNLEKIVDFRNSDEMTRHPDPTMEGVTHIWCPIFEERAGAVTREPLWDESNPLAMYFFFGEQMKKAALVGKDDLADYYVQFVTKQHSVDYYKKFFDVLLEGCDGSILWHCSAGKDRCGMGTVFLLKALGMSDETIYEDYLLTNLMYESENQKMIAIARERNIDPSFDETIRGVNGVRKHLLDSVYSICDELYGGLDGFLKEKLELNEEKITKLKELYLEK